MTTWNHRVCKEIIEGRSEFSIREVHYNDNGDIWAVGQDPCTVYYSEDWGGDPLVSIKKTLNWMLSAVEKPIIDLDTIKFAEMEEYENKSV